MSGIGGWCGHATGFSSEATLSDMSMRFAWRGPRAEARASGPGFGLIAVGPPGTIGQHRDGAVQIVAQGHPNWSPAGRGDSSVNAFCAHAARAWREQGPGFLGNTGGDFALALVDSHSGNALIAIDRTGVHSIVHGIHRGTLVFGATLDVVGAHPEVRRDVDPQALYDYVYFHMVPGPGTIYRGEQRLAPGHALTFQDRVARVEKYWTMRFDEHRGGSVEDFKPTFRSALREGVAALANGARCGAFLSGGTDSSTVAGTLGMVTDAPARTYSIGFAAPGYDEMEFARAAAGHFRTDHHEYYVTPDDVVSAAPLLAAAYDQPFGNASAVPTYYCARIAQADGIERMLGGDGGDELFGGNARYAKQRQLAFYERVPALMRRRVVEPLLLGADAMARIPVVRKARSYVEQARVPMPARYDSYNLLERIGPEAVFAPDFLAQADRDHPLARLREVYDAVPADSLINRMLALDLQFTLADNDLPKVTRSCEIAGVDVGFPLLHEAVVAVSAGLPPDFKLRGNRLRWFFKEALRDFLPAATLAKEKHGFGLPAGLWLRDHPPLRALAGDALSGLGRRRIFNQALLDSLLARRVGEHPGYYGTLAWVLMMLELWFQSHR